MSNMYITEYGSLGSGHSQIAQEPPIAVQKISFTGTPGTSAAFDNATIMIRVHVDGIASVRVGKTPVAAVTDPRMPADTIEYFAVPMAGQYKISAITNT